MAFFTDLAEHLDVLRCAIGEDVDATAVPALLTGLNDQELVSVLAEASAVAHAMESVQIAATGVVAARSGRERGHKGLSQVRGHRSPVSLVQELTGASRADAAKQVRLGESLLEAAAAGGTGAFVGVGDVGGAGGAGAAGGDAMGGVGTAGGAGASSGDAGDGDAGPADGTEGIESGEATTAMQSGPACLPWHAPLGRALLAGRINGAQHDAILRGLGQPPESWTGRPASSGVGGGSGDAATAGDRVVDMPGATDGACNGGSTGTADAAAAWRVAGEQLISEAGWRTVEELGAQARAIRDLLDPEGAQRRFDERYARRAFRMWRDSDGVHHGSFIFDDEAALWVRAAMDQALAPRRGGVRFVDSAEKARAQQLIDDPRTNDQLAHDLMIDLLRAGALADASTVFGTRQAGVRLVITHEAAAAADDGRPATGIAEDDGTPVRAWLVAQHGCDTATAVWHLDKDGNPLFQGRTARLFSGPQKTALALRDGGCRWPGCDRPASYCEAHHIDSWASGGRTDVDRGILLCRFHHMNLHHHGWRITRDGTGPFVLHPPGGAAACGGPIVLTTRAARRYTWRMPPPPPRFCWSTA